MRWDNARTVTTGGRLHGGSDKRSGAEPEPWALEPEVTPRFAIGTREVDPIAITPPTHLCADDIAQIAHDLKNPLSLISLEADLLDYKLDAGDRIDAKHTVSRIRRNVAFLDRMVHDLLDLCSLGTGDFVLRTQPTELRTLLESVIDRVVGVQDRARVFLQADEPVMVDIDDGRIERVVANFLTNALKFAPAATGVIVRLDREPGQTRVSVIDAGPGMTPAEMAYVFHKYRRTSSAGDFEGAGLGLYVSKQIVDAHGGVIGVDSVNGVGSRFYFELPA